MPIGTLTPDPVTDALQLFAVALAKTKHPPAHLVRAGFAKLGHKLRLEIPPEAVALRSVTAPPVLPKSSEQIATGVMAGGTTPPAFAIGPAGTLHQIAQPRAAPAGEYHSLPVGEPGPFLPQEGNMALDLGSLISQGIAAYQAVHVAEAAASLPPLPATTAAGTTTSAPINVPTPSGTRYPGMHTTKTCFEVVMDGAGNVIGYREIKRRNRRKRLLTQSDIADIAKLKGIVGTGKQFDSILAIIGRR